MFYIHNLSNQRYEMINAYQRFENNLFMRMAMNLRSFCSNQTMRKLVYYCIVHYLYLNEPFDAFRTEACDYPATRLVYTDNTPEKIHNMSARNTEKQEYFN